MCKSKMNVRVIKSKISNSRTARSAKSSSQPSQQATRASSIGEPSSGSFTDGNYTSGSSYRYLSGSSSTSTQAALSTIKESLADNAHIYEFSEICSATNNFALAKRFSSSSWRCSIRGKDVVVFQRKFRRPMELQELRERLGTICKCHHMSVIKLLGASISGNYIYLVYDYVHGANLAECLRNPRNPNFTVLSNWLSRMQIAADLAHGLDYIHHSAGLDRKFVHNRIKSSSIVVTEPSLNAKICHFGTAALSGEIAVEDLKNSTESKIELQRSRSRVMRIEGTRGYMAPEFQSTGIATRRTDVYAFGIVILELLSGKEPLKYRVDEESGGYERESVIEAARGAVDDGRLRQWVDRRLGDSYPVGVAEAMARMGLECVDADPGKRPDMGRVAGTVSKLYLESITWAEKMGVPTDFSVSLAPR
ncbi:protein LYK5-like [Malania oleifera]|uniref:protein LYK5-like n=1 Tax=Malania oleifera TaxID=397392 RepID=UPI0025ADC982|nr:protein LYK5-like [Malania oleifera]